MAFNEQLPQWENEGTQPPQSKRVEGWLPNEKPPASWFNWLFGRTYRVLKEFQEKAAEKVDVQQAQQTADDAATAAANAQSDIDDYKNEIRSLGLGLGVIPRMSDDLNIETQTGWVATGSETLNTPPGLTHGVVRIERRLSNRVAQTYHHLGGGASPLIRIFTRVLGDSWSDWVEVLHTGNTGSIVTEDYEVGSWTPEYITTGNPFANITISNGSSGTYVRIGRLVFIRFNLATSYLEKGNASGQLRIAGLPFPHGETSTVRHIGLSIANTGGFEISPLEHYYRWRIAIIPNSTEIAIYQNNPNSTLSIAGPEILQDHTSSSYNVIRASGVYYTSSS